MKLLAIIMAVGAMFIISANFMPLPAMPNTPLAAKQCPTLSTSNKPDMGRLKKSKINRLPRWHRVIPGMFR